MNKEQFIIEMNCVQKITEHIALQEYVFGRVKAYEDMVNGDEDATPISIKRVDSHYLTVCYSKCDEEYTKMYPLEIITTSDAAFRVWCDAKKKDDAKLKMLVLQYERDSIYAQMLLPPKVYAQLITNLQWGNKQ